MTAPAPQATTAYAELSTPQEMRDDARGVVDALHLDTLHLDTLHLDRADAVARAAVAGAPSLRYEDHPREVAKPEIRVSAAAARLAGSLHLHLD